MPTTAPKIVECRIISRTTHYDRDFIRPGLFKFSEILMIDENDEHYCSRTWDHIDDSPYARSAQVEAFRRRWEASHP